ncbi:MAG: hypothetical protein LQ341_002616 [Variospora aurantia]|nr:MAG: hypothetical protein LQ341_002616 [Variospora aurantia]
MTTSFTSGSTSRAEQETEYNRQYDVLTSYQAEYKTRLAALYRESRLLRALEQKVPPSAIPASDLDPRPNKNAPFIKDLISPGEDSDSGEEEGKLDNWTLNWKRVLGGLEIDVDSLDDEMDLVEKDNKERKGRLMRIEEVAERFRRLGGAGDGAEVVKGNGKKSGEARKKLAERMKSSKEEGKDIGNRGMDGAGDNKDREQSGKTHSPSAPESSDKSDDESSDSVGSGSREGADRSIHTIFPWAGYHGDFL